VRRTAALCSILTFYTNGDKACIDRLFCMSSPIAGSTDGSITIQGAIYKLFRTLNLKEVAFK
jgi:hypothetical protein